MNTNDYPVGADTDYAPWNEKSIKVDVSVCLSMSKSVEVEVPSDFTDYDLKEAVRNQIPLPSEEFCDWDEDDFEVILE